MTLPNTSMTKASIESAVVTGAFAVLSGGSVFSLDWGLKKDFRRYIARLINGVCEIGGGVVPIGRGEFRFPAVASVANVPWSTDNPLKFTGVLRFIGHERILNVTLIDPRIEFNADGTQDIRLTIASGTRTDASRVPFAALTLIDHDPSEGAVRFAAVLTEEGASLFAGNYTAGEDLDDITVRQGPRDWPRDPVLHMRARQPEPTIKIRTS